MRPPVTLSTAASDESLVAPTSPVPPTLPSPRADSPVLLASTVLPPPPPPPTAASDLPPPIDTLPPPMDDLPPPPPPAVLDDLPPPIDDLPPPVLDALPPPVPVMDSPSTNLPAPAVPAETGSGAPPPPPMPTSPLGDGPPPPPPPMLAKSGSQPRVFVKGRSTEQLLPPPNAARSGLLAALQGASGKASLKKAAPVSEDDKPKDAHSSLLDALRSPMARAKLRKVSDDDDDDGTSGAGLDGHSALMASLGGLGKGRKSLRRVKKEAGDNKEKGGDRNSITTALFNAMDARRGAISDSEGDGGSDDEDDDWEA
eukprot:m.14635 g.14635  ORF g.14635 m.14635 type:complete len:313 (+) comp10323_c0_seq1:1-939(+)